MRRYISCSMAAILVLAATLSAVKTSTAGFVPVDTVTANAAASQDIIKVRHHGGGAIFAGAALGLLGAAIAGNYYRHHYYPYYDPYYYPPYPYYYPPYRYYRYGCC